MGRVPGYEDVELDPQLVEAAKALEVAAAAYQQRVASVEGQYLRALEAAHDGDQPACVEIRAQLAAVRTLVLKE